MTLFTRFRAVAGGVIVGALVAACAVDGPTAPAAQRSASDLGVAAVRSGRGPKRGDTTFTQFTIDPRVTATYNFGGDHHLWVRAGGVCDRNSPYGSAYWDTPCRPTRSAVRVTARSWTDSLGHPRVDFEPKLRFTPLPGGVASAVLYFHDRSAATDPSSLILYCEDGVCVNEETTDPRLLTLQDRFDDVVFRQIKHFSGYEVAVGLTDASSGAAY